VHAGTSRGPTPPLLFLFLDAAENFAKISIVLPNPLSTNSMIPQNSFFIINISSERGVDEASTQGRPVVGIKPLFSLGMVRSSHLFCRLRKALFYSGFFCWVYSTFSQHLRCRASILPDACGRCRVNRPVDV